VIKLIEKFPDYCGEDSGIKCKYGGNYWCDKVKGHKGNHEDRSFHIKWRYGEKQIVQTTLC